jgi:hypothetical protein
VLALQEIYDRVADAGWDVDKGDDGLFRLVPPGGGSAVRGPSSPSDRDAITAMVAALDRAGLDPEAVTAIDPTGLRHAAGRDDQPRRRAYTRADADDERRKRHEGRGARMGTTDPTADETTAARIARLERELEEARAAAAREESVGAAESVAEWFRSGKEASTDEWVAVLSAAPESAVRAAGLLMRGGARTLGAAPTTATPGGRAPRLSIDEVAAQLPSAPFSIADLAARIGRETATTRNYIPKLLEAGVIVEAGEDSSGPGRAAKLYARA